MNVKIMIGLEDFRETANVGAHVGHRHFWQLFRHKGPLHGIIIDKHNTVKSNIELLGYFKDVARLWVPVCFECAKIVPSKYYRDEKSRLLRFRFRF